MTTVSLLWGIIILVHVVPGTPQEDEPPSEEDTTPVPHRTYRDYMKCHPQHNDTVTDAVVYCFNQTAVPRKFGEELSQEEQEPTMKEEYQVLESYRICLYKKLDLADEEGNFIEDAWKKHHIDALNATTSETKENLATVLDECFESYSGAADNSEVCRCAVQKTWEECRFFGKCSLADELYPCAEQLIGKLFLMRKATDKYTDLHLMYEIFICAMESKGVEFVIDEDNKISAPRDQILDVFPQLYNHEEMVDMIKDKLIECMSEDDIQIINNDLMKCLSTLDNDYCDL